MTTGVQAPAGFRPGSAERAQHSGTNVPSVKLDRWVWTLIVVLSAVVYLIATLFAGIDSPLFGLAMIVLLAREVTGNAARS
ncbi:MAG TPA: hypothetical protein VMJ75_09320 [Candidatus Acidoferrales bacterium]|nr:hypothetical protein [Candidatus Acidoferrales bacterium]